MNNSHVVQADGCVEMQDRRVDAFFRDDVVSRDVSVAGIDAGADGHDTAKALDDFGHLFKAPSQRERGSSSIFDQDRQSTSGEVKTLSGGGNRGRGLQKAGFAVGP